MFIFAPAVYTGACLIMQNTYYNGLATLHVVSVIIINNILLYAGQQNSFIDSLPIIINHIEEEFTNCFTYPYIIATRTYALFTCFICGSKLGPIY